MSYYIGYSINDNYFFSLSILLTDKKVLIDGKRGDKTFLSNDRLKVVMGNYIYNGKILSHSIDGKVFQITGKKGEKLKDYGVFYCKSVTKKSYNFYHKFKNPFLWFININKIKSHSTIYPPLNTSTGFQFSLMSFNICSSFAWTYSNGIRLVSKLIARANSDIICLQEIDQKLISKIGSIIYKKYDIFYYTVPECCILTKFKPTKVYKRTPLSPVYGIKIVHTDIKMRVFNSHLTDKGFNDPILSKQIQYPQLKIGLYDIYNSKNNPELPTILAGDHNTISHLDDPRLWKVSSKLQNDGWIDTYREVYPDVQMDNDYSYPNCNTNKLIHINETGDEYCPPTKSPNSTNLYRIDYIYSKNGANTTLSPIESIIIDKFGKKFPSDHNAIITTFSVIQ